MFLPGAIDHNIVRQASRGELGHLLPARRGSLRVPAALLHAKTMVIDGLWATVGSTNLDRRSFALNEELNLAMYDPAVAPRLEETFDEDLAFSRRLTYEAWKDRGFISRLLELLAVPLQGAALATAPLDAITPSSPLDPPPRCLTPLALPLVARSACCACSRVGEATPDVGWHDPASSRAPDWPAPLRGLSATPSGTSSPLSPRRICRRLRSSSSAPRGSWSRRPRPSARVAPDPPACTETARCPR